MAAHIMTDRDLSRPMSSLHQLQQLVAQWDGEHTMLPDSMTPRRITVIVPIRDEQETIRPLCSGILKHVGSCMELEILLIDDGSRDASWAVMESLARERSDHIRGLRLGYGAGKASALAAGFRAARGDVILTMDGDLQDDPQEIPRFLAKLDEGFDLVSGWKRVRHDPWHKVLPSRVFNWMASLVAGVRLHDHNCGFKCYRADVTRKLSLHGDLHRMIPSLAAGYGFRCGEVEVRHHPRRAGKSKYGWRRFLRGTSDILTVGFMRRFRQRPAHAFNTVACIYFGLAAIWALAVLRGESEGSVRAVGLCASVLLAALAMSTFLNGLLAELTIRGPLPLDGETPIVADTGIPSRQGQPMLRGASPFATLEPHAEFIPMMDATRVTAAYRVSSSLERFA